MCCRWVTWTTNRQMQHLPWAPNRPTKNGTDNNCVMLAARSRPTGRPLLQLDMEQTDIIDENCLSEVKPPHVPLLQLTGLAGVPCVRGQPARSLPHLAGPLSPHQVQQAVHLQTHGAGRTSGNVHIVHSQCSSVLIANAM